MKVIVTGGAGFIGSHLVEKLVKQGYIVYVFDNFFTGYLENLSNIMDSIELVKVDIREAEKVLEIIRKADIMFHLAAIPDHHSCEKNKDLAFEVNVLGTFKLFYYFNKYGSSKGYSSTSKRIVFSSTAHLYGNPEYIPIDEKHPVKIYNYYTLTKRLGEELAEFYNGLGTPVVILRFFNVYGPRQRIQFFIPSVICQALNKNTVHIWSDKPTRDFIYVEDAVEAMIRAMDTDYLGKPINIGSGVESQVGIIAKEIARHFNAEVISKNIKVTGPSRLKADISLARKVLGWNPRINLNEGLRLTVEWYKERGCEW